MRLINKDKLKAFFLISGGENNIITENFHPSIHHFTGLVQTCNIDTTVDKTVPDIAQSKSYNLIFIDLYNCTWGDEIPLAIQKIVHNARTVFFNAQKDKYDEKKLLLLGLEGIFYLNERLEIILRGITKLQQNERWFKRETMNSALNELLIKKHNSNLLSARPLQCPINLPSLTRRENTIIGLVSCGAKNQEIAEQLHISPNTVKTHLYSIFRKTSSRNRIELISWTQSYAASIN
ncbi:helix-turn-helix transcriptional regulator [Colwellia psychrerythraea]|uniref:Transcriptional regulator, LuxR family n=1 Tax=Colwellia psychrerythraea TaxID=28229 RepID=A0A099L2I8_COLPS|nr:LuxR C-terminal-related transcriptional regulator [Colwellia psychrerythraea]KGJ96377.1 transcriptional regulator, LuxR family [Colwellia psychrerythraea]